MKTWNIIIKYTTKDSFDVSCPPGESKLIIYTKERPEKEFALNTNVFEILNDNKLVPSKNSYDLLNLALGVYTADQMVSRSNNGYYGWSRYFKLFIPVNSTKSWEPVKRDLEKLLSYLSGDRWLIEFRQDSTNQPTGTKPNNPDKIDKVALFSGGLDSYIGGIDLLKSGCKVAFVSHYKNGVSESKTQDTLIEGLHSKYGKDALSNFKFYVQPNQQNSTAEKDNTSRARSFLFISLGLTVANSLGESISLNVPENGLISLNVPLTFTRLSSHSTRTTHPYFLWLFGEILDKLGISNKIHNPYQFFTKGEMMKKCIDQVFLKSSFMKTMSCAHPDTGRWLGKSPNIHCGYCTPCIIRRAAIKHSGFAEDDYLYKDLLKKALMQDKGKGSDIRAFKLAIERLKGMDKNSPLILRILSSGPLSFGSTGNLNDYVDIYKRGMNEVAHFFGTKIW